MAVYDTNSEEQTQALAEQLAKTLKKGGFIALDGDLGAGKTVFAKGVARGLHVKEQVVSPTYTLLRVYETGDMPLYHFDVYRVESADELCDTGFFDYAEGDGVCVCEWADRIKEELPVRRINVRIERVDGDKRKITVD